MSIQDLGVWTWSGQESLLAKVIITFVHFLAKKKYLLFNSHSYLTSSFLQSMALLRPHHSSSSSLSAYRFGSPLCSPLSSRRCHSCFSQPIRSSLPFPPEKAKYYKELKAAVGAVERACRLCVDVKKLMLSSNVGFLEKNDATPVTVADFGVQALISLELGRLFPSIPLVAEEDSAFLRASSGDNVDGDLVGSVVSVVADKVSAGVKPLTSDDVLEAIDKGGKDAFSFDEKPATYWVLDPIDGTRGFLRGSDSLYVVGLALVVEGEVLIGVMGCPNWREDLRSAKNLEVVSENELRKFEPGIIMIAHVGCGTWTRGFALMLDNAAGIRVDWSRCFVDSCLLGHKANFCIPDSQAWESLPLASIFSSTTDAECILDDKKVLLLLTCCGSLCKYLMVASGRASVFILRTKLQTSVKAWDHAVGMICVHEAGGQVTDWGGNHIDLAEDLAERRIIFPSGGVLVTNGILHRQILDMISSSSAVV